MNKNFCLFGFVDHSKKMDPRKKKEESLKRDRRNTYGENDKASRKSIRRRKQLVNQVYRRRVNQALRRVNQSLTTSEAEITEGRVIEIQRLYWKKYADQPLGDVLLNDLIREIRSQIHEELPESILFEHLEHLMEENGWEEPGIRVVMRRLKAVAINSWSCKLDIDLNTARKLIILLRKIATEQTFTGDV